MRAKPVASAWLTPREAARLVGWDKPDDDRKMIRTLRRIEKNNKGLKLLFIVPTPMRTRLMTTMAALRRALPDHFISSEEFLPEIITEKFTKTNEHIEEVAGRIGAHGSRIRSLSMRMTAVEAFMVKIQRGDLRLVKGGLK